MVSLRHHSRIQRPGPRSTASDDPPLIGCPFIWQVWADHDDRDAEELCVQRAYRGRGHATRQQGVQAVVRGPGHGEEGAWSEKCYDVTVHSQHVPCHSMRAGLLADCPLAVLRPATYPNNGITVLATRGTHTQTCPSLLLLFCCCFACVAICSKRSRRRAHRQTSQSRCGYRMCVPCSEPRRERPLTYRLPDCTSPRPCGCAPLTTPLPPPCRH